MDIESISTLTKQEILSADLMSQIFDEEDATVRAELIANIALIAKSYGCKVQFEQLVKAQRQQIKETKKQLEQKTAQNPLLTVSNLYTVDRGDDVVSYSTGRWKVSDKGIISQDGKTVSVAGYYPVIITKVLTDRNTGDEKLELTWKKNGSVKRLTAPRNVISSANKIVDLSRYGFPVTTETAKNLIKYLSDFEALNMIETLVCSSKFGWADGEFLPYTDEVLFDCTNGVKALTESVHEEGSFETWLDIARQIRASGRKEPLVYLAASFGSVLVHPLKILPFIVNMYGTTGSGKTVTLMLASSVWANPSEGGYISESNSTINALEMKLDTLNHLPLMIDDLSKLRSDDRNQLMNLIYGLCSGRGKGRMGRNGELKYAPTWSDTIITNMERPLADDNMRGGAMNRILDFEIEPGDIYKDGNHVVTVLSDNYGHAGHVFVKVIQEIGFDIIRTTVNRYRQRIRDYAIQIGEEKEDKQITPLAVMLAADLISEKYIFQDGIHLDFDYAVKAVKSRKQVSEMERAYKHFVDAIYINKSKFDADGYGDFWGKRYNDHYVAVIPSALNKIADQYNFNVNQFVQWCKNSDILLADKGRLQKFVTLTGYSDRARCYVIRVEERIDSDGFIAGEPDLLPDEPLPFEIPR